MNSNKKYKLFKSKKVRMLVAALGIAATLLGGCNKTTKDFDKGYALVQTMDEGSSNKFYNNLNSNVKEMRILLDYIDISEKLQELELDNDSIIASTGSKLLQADKINNLIEKLKVLRSNANDDKLVNELESILKEQEKLTNMKVYSGYYSIPNYLLLLAKYNLGQKLAKDPNSITLSNPSEGSITLSTGDDTQVINDCDNTTWNLIDRACYLQRLQDNSPVEKQESYYGARNNQIKEEILNTLDNIENIYDDYSNNKDIVTEKNTTK